MKMCQHLQGSNPWTGKESGGMLTWKGEWRNLRYKVQWPLPQVDQKNPDGKAHHGLAGVVSTPSSNEVNLEERYTGATINAVTMASDSIRMRR